MVWIRVHVADLLSRFSRLRCVGFYMYMTCCPIFGHRDSRKIGPQDLNLKWTLLTAKKGCSRRLWPWLPNLRKGIISKHISLFDPSLRSESPNWSNQICNKMCYRTHNYGISTLFKCSSSLFGNSFRFDIAYGWSGSGEGDGILTTEITVLKNRYDTEPSYEYRLSAGTYWDVK